VGIAAVETAPAKFQRLRRKCRSLCIGLAGAGQCCGRDVWMQGNHASGV